MSADASASADAPCAKLPPSYLLSFTAMKNAASNGTVFVTFTDNRLSPFAINWARQLHAIGLRSLVGTAELLGESAESALSAAGARIFCADRVGLMAANGQAGRWAEAQLVLRLARRLSLSVLLSDADIAWIRNPLSYFDAVRASHPGLDLLMMTDRAFNGYSSAPLKIQPATITPSHSGLHGLRRSKARSLLAGGAAPSSSPGGVDLELEPAYESSISYNIGVIWFCAHALVPLEEMLGRWVVAVGGGSGAGVAAGRASGGGTSKIIGTKFGGGRRLSQLFGTTRSLWSTSQPWSMPFAGGRRLWGSSQPKLAIWDQEPINKLVLQRGLRKDSSDTRLARVDSNRLSMGILPMLQFTTSFTFNMFRRRRAALGVSPPYCLHAIFAHGHEAERKMSIFREEGLWHDPPSYYDPTLAAPSSSSPPPPPPPAAAENPLKGLLTKRRRRSEDETGPPIEHSNFLIAEPSIPPHLNKQGGFEVIMTQLRQIREAFKLAHLLNRTLILPRLRCGERSLAYPCYAWYHRSMAYFGLNTDKVSMPDICPQYYWLDLRLLAKLPVATREPSFLENMRTPRAVRDSIGRLILYANTSAANKGKRFDSSTSGSNGGGGAAAAARENVVHLAGGSSYTSLLSAYQPLSSYRVLRVSHLQWLSHSATNARGMVSSMKHLDGVTAGFWCSACPVTRRGAVIHELNKSSVRELETFCKTEARGRLGLGPPMRSCCPHGQRLPCHECGKGERRTISEESLPWTTKAWIPTFAKLELSPREGKESKEGKWPVCKHPLCTGADRKAFP